MKWAMFDSARILAALALIWVCIVGPGPESDLALVLGTFVVTGLVVSFLQSDR